MIKVTRFQVPSQVRPGETRRLTCQYDLRGFTLHALKLFKDDKEVSCPGGAQRGACQAGTPKGSSRSQGHAH